MTSLRKNTEEWKPVVGYEGLYEVSNLGGLRSLRKRWLGSLRPWNKDGYCWFRLFKNGKKLSTGVHRLVLMAFVGPCPDGYQSAHLDGNRSNNCVSNLAWVTGKENSDHKVIHDTWIRGERMWNAKLDDNKVQLIRKLSLDGFKGSEIADLLNVSRGCIYGVINGKRWTHVK